MNQHEVLALAKSTGVLISGRAEFEEAVKLFGKLIIKRVAPRPLTKTQQIYLNALTEPKSLQDLADQFGCTAQNALKMVRVLECRKLVTKELLFKRNRGNGAWAFYYTVVKEKQA